MSYRLPQPSPPGSLLGLSTGAGTFGDVYLEVLTQLGKLPWLLRNVVALSIVEFDSLFT
jgi:hypothetical protein